MSTMTRVGEGRKRVAWGITGSGDKLSQTIEVMKKIKERYMDDVDIRVYLSKAGDQVVRHYGVKSDLEENFSVIREIDSNSPFLAGQLQLGRFEFLLIAPATSNTTAKILLGIADSLLSNAAIMALKGFTPVYIMPVDLREGIVVTRRPSGEELKIRVRKEDAENARRLSRIEGVTVLEEPEEIFDVFSERFGR